MSVWGRLKLVHLVLVLSAGLLPALNVVAASAEPGTPTFVDLPQRHRADPRRLALVGETDGLGIVVRREADPTARTGGAMQTGLLAGGTFTPLDAPVDAVLGNRLVQPPAGYFPTEVVSRIVPDGPWSATPVPPGQRLVDYTGDGLVLVSEGSPSQMSVLPWSGGELLPVTGLPEEASIGEMFSHARDGHGLVLTLRGSGFDKAYLDTSERRVWGLSFPGTSCETATTAPWGLGEVTIAWHGITAENEPVICTARRPGSGEGVGPFAEHPAPEMPVDRPDHDVALQPVGDNVVVSRRNGYDLGAAAAAPVWVVAPDGATEKILAWGHDVVRTVPGKVLVVGGPTPAEAAVRRVAVDGSSSETVAEIAPVQATYQSIAVDGGRVARVDDSAVGNAVVHHSLSSDGQTWAGPAGGEVLDTDVEDAVVAGEGATAWVGSSGTGWGLRDDQGVTTTNSLPDGRRLGGPVTAVSGRWILQKDPFRWQLIDTPANAVREVEGGGYDRALQDGVVYLPGGAVAYGPWRVVVARDLETKQAAEISVPGCWEVRSVQVAGSWMLLGCHDADNQAYRVVYDRTGAHPAWRLNGGGEVHLGNGFLVERSPEGRLSWMPLADGPGEWRSLGDMAAEAVAVSRGPVPTLAWYDRARAQLVRLPVTTSGLPARPVGLTPPSAPTVSVQPLDGRLELRWSPAAAEEKVTSYVVTISGTTPHRLRAGAPSNSYTAWGLANGRSYDVQVFAFNVAGGATGNMVSATPVAPPGRPRVLDVEVDPITSRATVQWDWQKTPYSEPLRAFDIEVGGKRLRQGIAPDRRSDTFVVPDPAQGVTVVARGTHQSNPAIAWDVSFPGVDTTAPRTRLTGVPAVLLARRLRLGLNATDDRAMPERPVDLRWRTASSGKQLGPWRRPAGWQRTRRGELTVTDLVAGGTYCFSMRARDSAGNVSRWSRAACMVVALDDRGLGGTGKWRSLSGTRYYRATAVSTRSTAKPLQRRDVRADAGWLVATTCPRCGKVGAWVGDTRVGTVNLYSPVRRDRRIMRLRWPGRFAGRLTLRAVSSNRNVIVDGVALKSY